MPKAILSRNRKKPQRSTRPTRTDYAPPTEDELRFVAVRKALLAEGVTLLLEHYARRLRCSVSTAFRIRRACIAKGLIPGAEDPAVADSRHIAFEASKQQALAAAEQLAPRGMMLDPLMLSKQLGWAYHTTRHVVAHLKRSQAWHWVDPPKPPSKKSLVAEQRVTIPPKPRPEPPKALEPQEHPRYRESRENPELLARQRAFEVAGYLAEWKARQRRNQRANAS